MDKTFGFVTSSIRLSQRTIVNFANDFNINMNEKFIGWGHVSYSILTDEFIEFINRNKKFLLDYQSDYYAEKSIDYISNKINRSRTEVDKHIKEFYPHFYNDGLLLDITKIKSTNYISSYKIDLDLGTDYTFLYSAPKFDREVENYTFKSISNRIEVVGYEDILHNLIEQLEPILNPNDAVDWGLENPGGILLFGPPGCGKTFWANNISKLINYTFNEIPRSIFGSTFVDGAMINLKAQLKSYYEGEEKQIVFFDEFDSIASIRSNSSSGSSENLKVVNTLLQEIPKLIQKKIIIVAATNFLEFLDPAVIRPGRFDLKIPVFPPNLDERGKLIIFYLKNKLKENSILNKILIENNCYDLEIWNPVASKMYLFSSSMIMEYTSLLKRRIKALYTQNINEKVTLTTKLYESILCETKAKVTAQDAEIIAQFYNEVKNINQHFYKKRLDLLYCDLQNYYLETKSIKTAPKPIGFRQPDI